MANLLYLVHRLPYPPNKGDKVRSFHLLQHLLQRHRVFLGTFIDDPDDEPHVATLRGMCSALHVARLQPRRARLASLQGLLTGESLTAVYYRDQGLRQWVAQTLASQRIDAAVVFSSSMAQYAQGQPGLPLLVDFVDVDSAKWAEYGTHHGWPLSWIYKREGRRLLALERDVAAAAHCSFFATDKETALFQQLAPECVGRVEAMNNGVDAGYFCPALDRSSPFDPDETALVFTGAMDYWPNVDAVVWFAQEVLPQLRRSRPKLRLHIVGRSPTQAVLALANADAGVLVTGTVPDVRPYLQHAAVVVAPLRLARGIQNKILEAMAMGRPVVAAAPCVEALLATPGAEIESATDADTYQRAIEHLLANPQRAAGMGAAGRQRVLSSYSWSSHMAVLERQLAELQVVGGSTERVAPAASALPASAA